MIIEILAPSYLFYTSNIRIHSSKDINNENEEMKKFFERKKQEVQPVSNLKNELTEYYKGRYLDVVV